MNIRIPYAMLFLFILGVLPSGGQQSPCEGYPYVWTTATIYAVRLNGNSVRAYAETVLNGPLKDYWDPYVQMWTYRNDSQIDDSGELGPGPHGGTKYVIRTATLSFWGPGAYRARSKHRVHNWYPGCGQWSPPYLNGWDGYANSSVLSIERPTVSMDHPIWYLGGVGGFGNYQVTGVLTADPKGAPETPVWTVTAGAPKIELGCTTCRQTYITARQPSSGCTADVTLRASVGGFPSETFFIFIDTPHRMVQTLRLDIPYLEGLIGYKSPHYYNVLGLCNAQLSFMRMNEQWEAFGKNNPSSTWPMPVPEDQWPVFEFDTIYAAGTPGQWAPQPREPLPGNACNTSPPISMTPQVMWHSQVFRAGSTQGGLGKAVQRNQAQWYEDHGCHLSIVSPTTNP